MKKIKPLISIITPTYNHENFIGQCIESVLAQTYKNWEQIIIDDGSTDKTSEVISKYKDFRIHYIKQKNIGIWRLSEIYNNALNISQGQFIAILEGDDYWPEDKLEKQLTCFDNKKVILSWGRGRVINENNQILYEIFLKDFRKYKDIYSNYISPIALKKLLIEDFITPAVTVMIRKDALIEISGFKQPYYAPFVDYSTWLELALIGNFAYYDSTLGYWRRHSLQMSSSNLLKIIEAQAKLRMEFFNSLKNDYIVSLGLNQKVIKSESCWNFGRVLLNIKNKRQARKEFQFAMFNGILKTRIKALVGLIISYFPISLESFIKLSGFNK